MQLRRRGKAHVSRCRPTPWHSHRFRRFPAAALQTIEEKLRRNTEQVMETARSRLILPRQAAIEMAEQRVRRAMGFRRFSLFSTAPDYI